MTDRDHLTAAHQAGAHESNRVPGCPICDPTPGPRERVIHGLVVPADATRHPHLTPIGSEASGRQLSIVGQLIVPGASVTVEVARYDPDAVFLVDEDGRARGLPVNVPATHYIKHGSAAAEVHTRRGGGWPAGYVLVGDVVVVGCDQRTPDVWTNVPERFLAIFGVAAPDA
jgi:hypothetical protein